MSAPARDARRSHEATRVEATLVLSRRGPVARPLALAALARQPELGVPAKLALAPGGEGELVAERLRTPGGAVEAGAVEAAADHAWCWLGLGGAAAAVPTPGDAALSPEALLAALSACAWPFEAAEGGCRAHARAWGESARLHATPLGDGGVRLWTDSVVDASAPGTQRALAIFALEANRRLRLARTSLVPTPDAAWRLVWDAVAAGDTPLDATLPALAEAVLAARAATAGPLRALTDARVSRAFLATRGE